MRGGAGVRKRPPWREGLPRVFRLPGRTACVECGAVPHEELDGLCRLCTRGSIAVLLAASTAQGTLVPRAVHAEVRCPAGSPNRRHKGRWSDATWLRLVEGESWRPSTLQHLTSHWSRRPIASAPASLPPLGAAHRGRSASFRRSFVEAMGRMTMLVTKAEEDQRWRIMP